MKVLQVLLMGGLLLMAPVVSSAQADGSATVTIAVDGLSCPFCAYGLEKHLKRVKGVASVQIEMQRGRAAVVLEPGAQVEDRALREAVKRAGFTARAISHH